MAIWQPLRDALRLAAIVRRHLPTMRRAHRARALLGGFDTRSPLHRTLCDAVANNHRTPLLGELVRRARFGAPLTVADYMRECLLHPRYGFYATRRALMDDFLTAPETGQTFGELLGAWATTLSPKGLVELGAGSGALLRHATRTMEQLGASPLRIDVVEASRELRAAQKDALAQSSSVVAWHDEISAALSAAPAPVVILANEFLDALPVHVFRAVDGAWREVLVDAADNDQLRFVLAPKPTPASAAAAPILERCGKMPTDGAIAEVSFHALAVVESVAKHVGERGGAALFVDYAASADRGPDTLRAYHAHKQVDLLQAPGVCDITFDVDFAQLTATVDNLKAPVVVHGPVSQRLFLLRLGIAHRFRSIALGVVENDKLSNEQKDKALEALQANYHTLVDEEKMGGRFAAMAITRHGENVPDGFL